jgi:uncharacterized protein (TIGR01777 family)
MPTFTRTSIMPAPVERLADWHFHAGALDRLLPPWRRVSVESASGGVSDGSTVTLCIGNGPFSVRWLAKHERVQPGLSFVDRQVQGPFAEWVHEHRFRPYEDGRSALEDHVVWRAPGGKLGALLGNRLLERDLARMFAWRHRRTANDLRRHEEYGAAGPLRVAVSGASGLVGRQVCAFLSTGGHQVRRIVRGRPSPERLDVAWDTHSGTVDTHLLDGVDAVVHLAGENIAAGRWSAERKQAIRASRVEGTRQIAEALASLPNKPKVLISASAIGLYGSRGPEPLDESSAPGGGFLPETCIAWEEATKAAEMAGIRVVHLRIGLVLAAAGGMLAKLRTPFSLGLGGPVGSGRQGMSWISLDDLIGSIMHCVRDEGVAGAVNAVAPDPRSNADFGRALGRAMRRPAIAPLPAPMVSALFGEMGRDLLLRGAFVQPRRLLERGFRFEYSRLEQALAFELGRVEE